MDSSIPEPSFLWTTLFMVGSYAMAASCLFWGIWEGTQRSSTLSKWKSASGQVLTFALLAGVYWFVESWAHYRTPFYLYSGQFPDLLSRLPFESWHLSRGVDNDCIKNVLVRADRIPLSVVLLEASLTYIAMWTARIIGARPIIQPLLAGLVLVTVDALLDPVAATIWDCSGAKASGIGLGFWRWYVPKSTPVWFGVPIFNVAAWFAVPVFAICLVNLLGKFSSGWLLPVIRTRSGSPHASPVWWEVLSLLLMILMIGFMFYMAPYESDVLSPTSQKIALTLLLAVAFVLVFQFTRPVADGRQHANDATLTRPIAVPLVIAAVAGATEGFFIASPKLTYVATFALFLGFVFAWIPYPQALRGFCERVAEADRFLRLHYFGFTSMLILLGAAVYATSKPDKFLVAGLLVIAVCFHIWSYLLNDVIDLDLDRTQPRRRTDPLVRGLVSKEMALAFAILQFPLAVLVTLHLVHFKVIANADTITALGVGFLLLLVYNLWGKTCPFPPLTDLIQGLGWGSLVVVGALIVNPKTTVYEFVDYTGPLVAYAAGFILLINGVHGGLRDLWTDQAGNRNTTARYFHAEPAEGPALEQPVRTTWGLRAYAFVVHTLMFSGLFYLLLLNPEISDPLLRDPKHPSLLFDPSGRVWAWGGVSVLFVVNNCMLWQVVKELQPRRDLWSSMHVLVLLLAPLWLYFFSTRVDEVFNVVILLSFFIPLALQEDVINQLRDWLYRGGAFAQAPQQPPSPMGNGTYVAADPGLAVSSFSQTG